MNMEKIVKLFMGAWFVYAALIIGFFGVVCWAIVKVVLHFCP
jgi:hypothetical protein